MISLVAPIKSKSNRAVVGRLCRTLTINRSSYFCGHRGITDPGLELFGVIQKLFLSWPSCGNRPMKRALQHLGYRLNHKRVLRRMREDNLLALRDRDFVSTTDSNHDHNFYADLLPALNVT